MSGEDVEWDCVAANPSELRRIEPALRLSVCSKAWSDAVVLVLNTLAEAPQSLERNNGKCFKSMSPEASLVNEHEALRILRKKVMTFLKQISGTAATSKS